MQVAVSLDALGWEQATTGGSVTAEYWQFAARKDTLDIGSVASQHGTDDESTCVGLRTPPSAFERRTTGAQQLARESQQSSVGSQGPSPANSAQLHHPPVNVLHETISNEQQRLDNNMQQQSPADTKQHELQHSDVPVTLSALPQQHCSPFAHEVQQHPGLTREQQKEQQAVFSSSASHEQVSCVASRATVLKRGELVSEPPSASWHRVNQKADIPKWEVLLSHVSSAPGSSHRSSGEVFVSDLLTQCVGDKC